MSSVVSGPPLEFDGRIIRTEHGQTVLSALEAAGVVTESSCRAGVCQTCLMQAVGGVLPAAAQAGLSSSQIANGLFMPCVCVPETALSIARSDAARYRTKARVQSVEWLSETVIRLRLLPQSDFPYRPGQLLNLISEDGVIRSYSIASVPNLSVAIELHIRLIANGRMSGKIATMSAGEEITISGPSGLCTYEGIDADQTLILAGTGTGLAPLWGVLNDALLQHHRGEIYLYHGGLSRSGLYLTDELEALQADYPNFHYVPCIADPALPTHGDITKEVTAIVSKRKDADIFLCGDAALVTRMKRIVFLAGAKLTRIHADAFVAAA